MSDAGGDRPEEFRHTPVLLERIVDLFAPVPPGWVVDATVGGAGHAVALLERHPHLRVLGIDQDADALAAAADRLAPFGDRAALLHVRFDAMGDAVEQLGTTPVTGALFDLGVSSPQLDRATRGFSYRHDAPLDMRMDPRRARTAHDIVNDTDERELAGLLRAFGDERFAGRIARAIVGARPLATTGELAEVVRAAIPAPAAPHRRPSRQANVPGDPDRGERGARRPPRRDRPAIELLSPGGRCAVLSYHSGEDRIAKQRLRHAATGGWKGPAHLPPPDHARPTVRLLKAGAWTPDAAERAANPRAASARLRAAEKVDPTEGPST